MQKKFKITNTQTGEVQEILRTSKENVEKFLQVSGQDVSLFTIEHIDFAKQLRIIGLTWDQICEVTELIGSYGIVID